MLLGRLPERAALSQLLDSARAGRSGGLVMHGQPGVGKTALLEYATSSSPSPSRGCGPGSYRTRSSLAGYPPGWAAPAHPMTCHSPR